MSSHISNHISNRLSDFHLELPKENTHLSEFIKIKHNLNVLKKSLEEYSVLINSSHDRKLQEYELKKNTD